MRKTLSTELFKKIMALAKELGISVNLGTRTNVLPHPAFKDLTTTIANETRIQHTPVEDVKSIFEQSLARIAQIDDAGGRTLLHNLNTLKKAWHPPENVVQYMDPGGLGGLKIKKQYTATKQKMKEAGFDPDSPTDQLKFMDIESASKKAGTDKGVGSLMKTKKEIIPPATEGDVGAKVVEEVPFEDQGLGGQARSLMEMTQKLADDIKGISPQERIEINKKEMSDFVKELKEKNYAQDEIAELFDTEHTLDHIKSVLLPRTDKARGFGARTKSQKDVVRDLEDAIEMYAQEDPDYLTQHYLNQKDMNYAIRDAIERDLKATGKFTDDELYDLTTHNMNIDQGTADFLMEAGTTIKLQGKGEMFDPTFYETMATHYLGPIKDTIPFAEGGRVGLRSGTYPDRSGIVSLPLSDEDVDLDYELKKIIEMMEEDARARDKRQGDFQSGGDVGLGSMFRNKSPRVGYVPGGPVLKKGAAWFIKAIRKNLDDMMANHPRFEKIPNEEKDLLAQQMQTLIHSLEAGDEVPKEALESIYKNPQYYKTPRVQRGGDPEMVEVEELIQEKLLPDVSEELVNFETVGRKPNVSGGRVGYVPGGPVFKGAFKKFFDLVAIKISNEMRKGLGVWKDLTQKQRITQHDNFTKALDNVIKTGKFDKKINEYAGFDIELAFFDAQAKAGRMGKTGPGWKKAEIEGQKQNQYLEDLDKRIMDEMDITKSEMDNMSSTALDDLRRNADPIGMEQNLGEITPGRGVGDFADDPSFLKDDSLVIQKMPSSHQENKILDAAYEDVAHHLKLEDLKYEADVLADSYANQLGKVYDDMGDAERSALYDQSYRRLSSNLKVQMDLEKMDQKAILGEFDVTGRKQNAFGGGVGSMFRRV